MQKVDLLRLSRELRQQVLKIAVPSLGLAFLYALGKTWRVRVLEEERYEKAKARHSNVIFIGWHEHVLTSTWMLRHRQIAILASQSRDGEYLARLTRLLGFCPVRGSSSRGGARGMRQLIRALEEGHDVLIGPDGPRGPARECKAGVVLLARHSGRPIVPCAGSAVRFKRLKSWDQTIIPMPFTRFTAILGEPIIVPADSRKTEIPEYQRRIGAAINALQLELEKRLGISSL
ncbi:hypothetical protein CSB45_05525 [candidate division KSB3 bacterium]|uniref:DUF374 domain-containing protein n=1 Tax=candidate division KSB3 bacterium TaxID=2044937 RepID=A0A2G6E6N0_9BACT|nr:MAG: hypothetical protein CSB45_05525 [candidate division KSB3 bacterium]PIE30117.1 MAG: hypothetical protein CSA57_04235 [candidate division KSB3 bacterium]